MGNMKNIKTNAISRQQLRSSTSVVLPARPAMKKVLRAKVAVRASANTPTPDTATPTPVEKMESIQEMMKFDGVLPERVNGRLAMLGFVAAVGAELTTGQTAFTQFANHPFTVPFHWAIFAVASAMPAVMSGNSLKGIMEASGEKGLPEGMKKYNADVELLNGRAAM